MLYLISILAVHLLICLLVYLGIEFHILKVHRYMFFVVFFLPFWGLLTLLILHFQILFEADDGIDVGVEKLKLESELYKSVTVDENKNAKNNSTTAGFSPSLYSGPSERSEISRRDRLHNGKGTGSPGFHCGNAGYIR